MAATSDMITVHVNIELPADALKQIVHIGRQLVGVNEKGHFQVDTADLVSRMVTRFLLEKDFKGYVRDEGNYDPIP